MDDLTSTFSYTGGFVACNFISTFFALTNCLPLQMLSGKAKSKNGVKCFCEGHYYAWGSFLGVRDGDRCDAYTCAMLLPLLLSGWVPCALTQLFNVMASTYWALNMMAIVSQLQQNITVDRNVETGPNMAGAIFAVGQFILLNALYRLGYFALPNVPGDGHGFAIMLGAWYFVCVLHAASTIGRCYWAKTQLTFKYMNDLWQSHDNHMKANPEWDVGALHPKGFDVLTMGPLDLLSELRASTGEALATAEEVEAHIESWMDKELMPFGKWCSLLVAFIATMVGLPFITAAIVEAIG